MSSGGCIPTLAMLCLSMVLASSDQPQSECADPIKPLSAHNGKPAPALARAPKAVKTGAAPAPKAPAKRQKSTGKAGKARKKVAEVIDQQEGTAQKSDAAAQVSDQVLQRIRKALALGLHDGGNADEKKHAMQRATRLMQQHGLSQAGARRPGTALTRCRSIWTRSACDVCNMQGLLWPIRVGSQRRQHCCNTTDCMLPHAAPLVPHVQDDSS
jgi:Protein of unknown function (DUF2786)